LALRGKHIYLRSLRETDFEDFCAWYADGQVTRLLGMKPSPRDKTKTMFNQLLNDPNGVYFGIIKKNEERIIGYAFLAKILRSHRIAREFGIVIGDKNL